jgi:hypothetical protein
VLDCIEALLEIVNRVHDLGDVPGSFVAGRRWKRRDHSTIQVIADNSRFPWVWIYTSTAIVLGIAVGVFAWLAVQSHREAGLGRTANAPPPRMRQIPVEGIELLASIEPPAYEATASADVTPEFRAALEEYRKRNYSGAIAGLQAATQAQPQSAEAHFYLAICLLMTNDRSGGIQELQAVIAAGSTPYLEAARFYLAKALLADGNIRGADIQLRVIVEMHSKLEKQAQTLHAQIVPSP